MGRFLGLPLVLVTLVIGAVLFVEQSRSEGPTSHSVRNDETAAMVSASGTLFSQVTEVLAADYGENGTYAGAALPPGSGVQLAWASQSAYCLQASVNSSLVHEVGPNGSPAAGACPA